MMSTPLIPPCELRERFLSVTWALFVAGCPAQVVSQWSVQDDSTAELMKRFYTHLMSAGGKGKGAALRAAELELMKDPRWGHPHFWAPFILVGDWR